MIDETPFKSPAKPMPSQPDDYPVGVDEGYAREDWEKRHAKPDDVGDK